MPGTVAKSCCATVDAHSSLRFGRDEVSCSCALTRLHRSVMHKPHKRKLTGPPPRRKRNAEGLIFHDVSDVGTSFAIPTTQNQRVREWNIRSEHVSTYHYTLPLPPGLSQPDDDDPLIGHSSLFPEDSLPQPQTDWFQGDFDPFSGQLEDMDDSVFNSTKKNRTRSVSIFRDICIPALINQ